MSKERSERGKKLVAYVQDNIRRLEEGEITRLPTLKELAHHFGYSNSSSPHNFLARRGIWLGKYESYFQLPHPSIDLSWFLGVLSAGGHLNLNKGEINLTNAPQSVLEKYRIVGERLFPINIRRIRKKSEDRRDVSSNNFSNVKAARFLGDLRSKSWAETIQAQHPWLITTPAYIWGFIQGFFDESGGIYTYERAHKWDHRITLSCASHRGAGLLTEMLVRGGIKNPSIDYETKTAEKVNAVTIYNLKDIQYFAKHVHSVVPEKERGLEYYRTGIFASRRPLIYTNERLIQEWCYIRRELNHDPSSHEIVLFQKAGKTRISPMAYAKRFGSGSFIKAREELERIIREGQ